MISIKSLFSRPKAKPRLWIDASHFDPCQELKEEVLVVFSLNEAETIYTRVSAAKNAQVGMVVVDQGSTDGTPFYAAEAGAVVVMMEAGQPREAAFQEAMRIARGMARVVSVCD